jgi:hypothetical protein
MAFGIIQAVTGIAGKVADIVEKRTGDKDLATKIAGELEQSAQQGEFDVALAQLEVNKAEAESPSLFKSGWRPAVGWVCALAFAYNFIMYPFLKFIVVLFMDKPPEFPVIAIGEMMPVLLGMLGLGYMRTQEKKSGVAAK